MKELAGTVQDITSESELDAVIRTAPTLVHFWAPWSEPCKHMHRVTVELAKANRKARFVRVEAEEVVDLSERYDVAAVPYFLFFKNGVMVDELEGADTAELMQKAALHLAPPTPVSDVARATSLTAAARKKEELTRRLTKLVSSAPVMLFMKGSPEQPRCGFSAKVVAALQGLAVPFQHFDILADDAVRDGLKEFSAWPTYPQLYVKGDLIGGADIVLEMASTGELARTLGEALAEDKALLNQRLRALVHSAPIMLFMKGSPTEPKCKFSRAVVEALRAAGGHLPSFAADFKTFDILQDESVRTGLKDYSNWPTFPQLYIRGELLGGADIVAEMAGSGELREALQEALQSEGVGDTKQRIQRLLQQQPVMLFMKGTPEQPRCGFSRRVVAALQGIAQPFGSFDVLSDETVRQGVKEVSEWPTFPQLFVKGELLGGCDIVEDLAGGGQLKATVDEMLQQPAAA